MRRLLPLLALASVLLVGTVPVRADSLPVINGSVSGIELCPQSLCGAAVFVGVYSGQVGRNYHAFGTMATAITHDDLPDVGQTAAITGGLWRLRLLSGRTIAGDVTGGTLANPRGDNTFDVTVDLHLVTGGAGWLTFSGILSHNNFPPTINGSLTQ